MNIHYEPLGDKILKDKGWNQTTFDLVDWENFHKAIIISVPRSHRVSITKLSQGLWNMNVQNGKFYGHLNTCPYCHTEKETIQHIFCCDQKIAQQERDTLTTYKATLISKRTPPQLVDTIVAGITISITRSLPQNSDHLALGHSAGREQEDTLDWVAFLQGHISQKWKDNFQASISGKTSVQDSHTWAKNLILANWAHSKSIWANRNAVVHGRGAMEMEERTITTLKCRIHKLYLMFQKDKYCVPYTRTHLFDHPLLILQQLPKENMQCWIRSVEEAVSTQQSREALHGELSRYIMARFLGLSEPRSSTTTTASVKSPLHQ
jgi:hypothetical protein